MSEESATPDLVELSQRLIDAGNALDFDAAISFYARDSVLDGRGAIRLALSAWPRPTTDIGDSATFSPTTTGHEQCAFLSLSR
jgi:hypothetical protein